jgi:predicted dehydrogenase
MHCTMGAGGECDKPIAMDAKEAAEMVAEQTGRIRMEAFHDRYHPAFLHLLGLKTYGRLGKLKWVKAEFYVGISFNPKSIRHDPAQGGGAMMDLGCYPVHWVRSIMDAEPEILSAKGTLNPLGVDPEHACGDAFSRRHAGNRYRRYRQPAQARVCHHDDRGYVPGFTIVRC